MSNNSNNKITLLAETNFRGQRKKFGIKKDDRRRHMYVVGKTGMGKSVFMENMIIADIRAGNGVAVVDPHGDLVERVINFIPSNRINDVVYFNPADADFPVAFNILEAVDEDKKSLVASGMMGVFKKIWPDVWSSRMEYILNNTILALLDYQDSTMLGVNRMTYDKEYRKKVYPKIKDTTVKSFWINEFEKWDDKFRKEAVAAIQNKVGQFLSSFVIRNIVGQPKSTINMREIMDDKKILLINLSKGRIGEDAMRLLGGMIITKLQLAAMSRVDIPEEEREDFYLYVDEFQNFATESFASILSEARKYHLNLIVAHQYIEQLAETVKPAIFGNVGTMVVFRVGAEDSEFLAKEFTPQFTETDFVNLTKYNVYMKLMIDGVASTPFSAVTFPPAFTKEDNKDKIIRISRERYAEPRLVVEDKIKRWSGMTEETGGEGKAPEKETEKEPPSGKFESVCSVCGNKTFVSFEPDGIRPVYCKDCLKKIKAGEIKPLPIKRTVPAFKAPERGTRALSPARNFQKEGSIVIKPAPKAVSLKEALGRGITPFSPKKPDFKPEEKPKTPVISEFKKMPAEPLKKEKEINEASKMENQKKAPESEPEEDLANVIKKEILTAAREVSKMEKGDISAPKISEKKESEDRKDSNNHSASQSPLKSEAKVLKPIHPSFVLQRGTSATQALADKSEGEARAENISEDKKDKETNNLKVLKPGEVIKFDG